MHIVVIAGSNRDGALSRGLARHYAQIYRSHDAQVDLLDLAELPPEALLGSVYKEPTASITALVDRFLAAEGVHWVVPEYNGGFPGVLKLLIDLLPYPAGLDQRPCAFTGLAAGQFQGLRAVEQLQQVVGYRNALQYPRRLFIGHSFTAIAAEGTLLDESLSERLDQQAKGFLAYITALASTATSCPQTSRG